MSFQPLRINSSTALSGTIEPTKFFEHDKYLEERHIHGSSHTAESLRFTIIIIIISAILFVTIIAIYDIVRIGIINHYANKSLHDKRSQNNREDIERTIVANENSFWASIAFATFCIISAVILVFLLTLLL